jgi:hypothetical protein
VADIRRLRLSKHATIRMKERGFTRQDVEFCIQNVETSYADPVGNPCYTCHLADKRRIEVVIRKDSDPPFVITVMD